MSSFWKTKRKMLLMFWVDFYFLDKRMKNKLHLLIVCWKNIVLRSSIIISIIIIIIIIIDNSLPNEFWSVPWLLQLCLTNSDQYHHCYRTLPTTDFAHKNFDHQNKKKNIPFSLSAAPTPFAKSFHEIRTTSHECTFFSCFNTFPNKKSNTVVSTIERNKAYTHQHFSSFLSQKNLPQKFQNSRQLIWIKKKIFFSCYTVSTEWWNRPCLARPETGAGEVENTRSSVFDFVWWAFYEKDGDYRKWG